MQDLLDIKINPEKAKPGIRYLAAAFDYFLITCTINMFYSRTHQNTTLIWIYLFVWLIYFPIIEGVSGQTLGKRLFRLRVLKDDFSKNTILRSFIRRIFDVIDFIPMFGLLGIIIASSNSKVQRIGDMIAKTIVVKE